MITSLDILSVETWILLITIFVLIRLYIYKKWQFLKKLNIPHDPPSILGFGNAKEMMSSSKAMFTQDLILKKKYGPVFGLYMGLSPRITIGDPEILKHVFIKDFSNFRDRQAQFTKINGAEINASLLNTSGTQWKRTRNTLSPIFTTSKLKEMFGIIDSSADRMVENLRKMSNRENGKISPKETFGKLSMEVICSAAFSVDIHSQEGETCKEVEIAQKLVNMEFFNNPMVIIFMLFPWTEKIAEKFNYCIFGSDLVGYYKRLVDALIKNNMSGGKKRVDIMQLMLKNEMKKHEIKQETERGMTREEIVGNSIVLLLAGYDTTAITLLFLVYCIAMDKEVQDKLEKEVEEAIEKHDGLTYEAINDMKYLDMCLNESQRMYGVVPRNSRYCEEDITIKGMRIPGGIHVDVPVYAMHHDEEYWDEPWEFKPERFEDMSKIDPIIFQPFGAGPRNCIGMRFAIMEIKVAIAKILINFNLGPCEDTPPHPLPLTMKSSVMPENEIFLRFISKNTEEAEL